jgi:hypothetical protein
LHTSTSCDCGYANPSDNWSDVPSTLNRSLGNDRGEEDDILEGDIPGDANRVACDLGAVLRVVCGPVHDRHREVEFQEAAFREVSQHQEVEFPVVVLREAEFQEVSQHQVVFVQGVRSQVADSVDYRHSVDCLRWVDRPFQAWRAAARRSVDDFSKSPPLRHLRVWYLDDQG